MSIVFRQLVDHTGGALSYLLADMESRRAVLIDPLPDDGVLLSALLDEQGLALQAVIRTHVHTESMQGHAGAAGQRACGGGSPA